MKYRDPITGEFKELTVNVADTMPVGTIVAYSSIKIPTNWLECKGQAISRETYADLFSKIGVTFGEGDGSTTFNLPDLRGKTVFGYSPDSDNLISMGNTGGEATHTLTIDEIPAHTHKYGSSTSGNLAANGSEHGTSTQTNSYTTSSTGGGQAHNNMPPYLVATYIIKVSAGAVGNVAQVVSTESDSEINTYSCNYINNLNEKIQSIENFINENVRSLKTFIELEDNTDLNTITAYGTYRSVSSEHTSTMTNVPLSVGGGFTMYVSGYTSTLGNKEYRRQEIIYTYNTYIRNTTDAGQTWTDWKVVKLSEI